VAPSIAIFGGSEANCWRNGMLIFPSMLAQDHEGALYWFGRLGTGPMAALKSARVQRRFRGRSFIQSPAKYG
jgi:hypothetical protein